MHQHLLDRHLRMRARMNIQLSATIAAISDHLSVLGNLNVVIGGTHALFLHGIIMHRAADDIDLIIFQPTDEQRQYVQKICAGDDNEADKDDYEDADYNTDNHRSYKLAVKAVTVNFLLSTEELPDQLLLFSGGNTILRVNSVQNIIDAKSAYFNGEAFRAKDVKDCEHLKQYNFNLIEHK